MPDETTALLRQGMQLQQGGDLAAAVTIYRRILETAPGNPDALHFCGLIALQQGDADEAVRLIEAAIAKAPGQPPLLSNLGIAQRAAGRPADALRSYDAAIALYPDYAEAHNNRGIALEDLDRGPEALAAFDRAIALRPDYADAFYSRGNVLRTLRRRAEALVSFERAIEIRPNYAKAHNNRGDLLQRMGRIGEALESFEVAIAINPNYVEALYNRGNAFRELHRYEDALHAYQRVLELNPEHIGALTNCANAALALNRANETLEWCDRAIAVRLDAAGCLNNRGIALSTLNRHEEAIASFNRALTLDPEDAAPRMNRGMSRLALGDYDFGWKDFEWRWRTARGRHGERRLRQTQWRGSDQIAGKTILLHAEQGLGDTLQFCRFVPQICALADVVVEVQPPLRRLLATLDGGARVIARGEELPPFDLQCPLLSLPLALGTTLATIPAAVPYLSADPVAAAEWRRRLAALPGLRVGIVWAGGVRLDDSDVAATDRRRSMTLDRFAPLSRVGGVSLISLQKGEPAQQARNPPPGMMLHDWTDELEDFADTAALLAALDLVITVDTSVAHLAGALARPVWILNRFDACWRWLLEREDSPWYPTARLFRQPAPEDWDSVMMQVCDALRQRLDLAPQDREDTLSAG